MMAASKRIDQIPGSGPRPRVLLSVATSIDGFIDDGEAERLLLSNDEDFDRVDAVRARSDAILLGAGAIRTDDPRVVVRSERRRRQRLDAGHDEHPLKVTMTRSGDLDPGLRWFHSGGSRLIYTTDDGARRLRGSVGDRADIVSFGNDVDVADMLVDLGRRGVARLMVEGGQQIHTALLVGGAVDEIDLAVAPLLVGAGPRFVGQGRFPWPSATRWQLTNTSTLGDVVVLHYAVGTENRPSNNQPSNNQVSDDLKWLRRAVDLAERCPPSATAFSVGACIVDRSGREISHGFSREVDDHVHAEESALAKVGDRARLATATMYSSLEPCGKRASRPTPCAHLIIESGIRRVVMAWSEPSDYVEDPEGLELLRSAGVDVIQLEVDRLANYRP